MAAPSGNDGALDCRAAAKAFLSFSLINAMRLLKFSTISIRIDVVRNRRASRFDCTIQDSLYSAIQPPQFFWREIRAQPLRIDARAPKALVRVNVADTAQHRLIEQQRLDSRPPVLQKVNKLLFRRLQWLKSQRAEALFLHSVLNDCHAAESPHVCIAQLAPVIEGEEHVSMRHDGRAGVASHQLPGHPQMN